MKQGFLYLPVASVLEILGVLTWITNETSVFPTADIGFSVPYLVSAEIQGFVFLISGAAITFYAIKRMSE